MIERRNFEVVVGVDGTASSLHAVKWAAEEAASRDGTLRLVHASPAPTQTDELPDDDEDGPEDPGTLRLLEVAVLLAATVSPTLTVRTEATVGAPAVVLSEASRNSDLLVLGDRGPGVSGPLVDDLASTVSALATCPVFIVRGRVARTGPVVVGLDGSARDADVLAAGFARAARAETSMIAIQGSQPGRPDAAPPGVDGSRARGARRDLDRALERFAQAYPSVSVERHVVTYSPTVALLLAAADAQLVVLGGTAASGALRDLLAASIGCEDLHHAHCPVELVGPVAA